MLMPILIPMVMLPSRRYHASALRGVTEFESQDAVDHAKKFDPAAKFANWGNGGGSWVS